MKRLIFIIMLGLASFMAHGAERDRLEIEVNGLVLGTRDAVVEKATPHIQKLPDYKIIRKGIKSEAELYAFVFYEDQITEYVKQALKCQDKKCQVDEKQTKLIASMPDTILQKILPKYLKEDGVVDAKLATQALATLRWMSSPPKEIAKELDWKIFKVYTSEKRKKLFVKAENCLRKEQDRHRCDKELQADDDYIQTELQKITITGDALH